ncbi:hypothetical protein NXG27_10895 [Megasphaera paucivorans]|uniref:Uncharacterized conserved protein, DUF697 family n=2 Tax=Megasphaera paucivorans TaxID=349095 RepID=A0A1G9TZH1_9FIRM|nr:hypothetical protein [Megasphaera paucivorans]SDM53028.1 Uncharacterized conserved protein, DUF697 family [Megasphaera paucivorans]
MTEEAIAKMEQMQKEIDKLREELAQMKLSAEKQENVLSDETMPADSLEVIRTMDETTSDDDLKVETLCRWAAARAGVIVVAPLLGTAALMANEVYLVSRIARVYGIKLSERAVIAFIGATCSRMAGNFLTTLIPISAIQIPIAVGITYSLGRVTQRWLKDGMPSDMGPYIAMMGDWKEKAKDQVDKLRDNPLQNIPLGDETVDFMKKWGNTAKDIFMDMKEKGQEALNNVCHRSTLVDEIVEEQESKVAAVKNDAAQEAAEAPKTTEEQVKEAVEKAKTPIINGH